jgi:hypothetical protein
VVTPSGPAPEVAAFVCAEGRGMHFLWAACSVASVIYLSTMTVNWRPPQPRDPCAPHPTPPSCRHTPSTGMRTTLMW